MTKWYERLTIAREAQGLKKSHFATMIGVKPAVVTEWEAGLVASPSSANTMKICEALKVSPDWLINGEENASLLFNQKVEIKKAVEIMESLDENALKQVLAIISTFAPGKPN